MAESDREDYIFKARLAEQAERYEDMVEYMKVIAAMGTGLSSEERNLLSVAYKNVIGAKRSSWRILRSIHQMKESDKSSKEYLLIVEKELLDICHDILDLLTKFLIPSAESEVESKVFYYKMKGDYYRYMAEFSVDEKQKEYAEEGLKAYKQASDTAAPLASIDPIKLGLALNFSVFFYEILNSPERACELAKEAFDEGVQELDSADLQKSSTKDTTLILQLLRDNLTLWASEIGTEGNDNDEEEKIEDM